jgi:arsenite/tail-anchored protein-transporting ATPase
MRIILTTGKGGVGKSTVAAATAVRCAAAGRRTAVMSVDSAHNLADVFGTPVGDELRRIAPRLDAIEVNLNHEIRANWSAVIGFFRNLTANNPHVSDIVAEECAVFPGMEEVFGLLRMLAIVDAGQHDVLVIDAPPTGDTLKFLRLPDVMEWFFRKYYPLQKRAIQTLRPFAGSLNVPLPDDQYLTEVEQWHQQVARVAALLADASRVTVRLVLTPEQVALRETRRAYAVTSLFGLVVDAIIVNRLFPAETSEPFLRFWVEQQREVLEQVETEFAPLPILRGELQASEVIGVERLGEFGAALFGERDPAALMVEAPTMELIERDGECRLRLRLPFLSRDNFRLWIANDSLVIALHGQRRHVPLPAALLRRTLSGASYDGGILDIRFCPTEGNSTPAG